jgi:hypothetical protein
VLLMTMNDVAVSQPAEYRRAEGIRALSANQPGRSNDANAQCTDLLFSGLITEAHERGRDDSGHMPREFTREAFGASDDAVSSK